MGVISGFMHASPPTLEALTRIISQKNNFSPKDVTMDQFIVTEIGYDYKVPEESASLSPGGLIFWKSQLDEMAVSYKNFSTYSML